MPTTDKMISVLKSYGDVIIENEDTPWSTVTLKYRSASYKQHGTFSLNSATFLVFNDVYLSMIIEVEDITGMGISD